MKIETGRQYYKAVEQNWMVNGEKDNPHCLSSENVRQDECAVPKLSFPRKLHVAIICTQLIVELIICPLHV